MILATFRLMCITSDLLEERKYLGGVLMKFWGSEWYRDR